MVHESLHNKLMRALACVLALSMGLAFAGCSKGASDEDQIRAAVANTFDVFKSPTKEGLASLGDFDDDAATYEEQYGIDYYDFMASVFNKFDYTINSVEVSGDTATVDVTFTNVNASDVMDEEMAKLDSDEEFNSLVESVGTSGDMKPLYKYMFDKMSAALKASDDVVTNDMTMHLEKKDGEWDISDEDMEELQSNIMGGADLTS